MIILHSSYTQEIQFENMEKKHPKIDILCSSTYCVILPIYLGPIQFSRQFLGIHHL